MAFKKSEKTRKMTRDESDLDLKERLRKIKVLIRIMSAGR